MNNELLATLEYIEHERGIKKDLLVGAVERAIVTSASKSIHPAKNLSVKLNPVNGEIKAWAKLKVVEEFPTDDEILLDEAKKRIPNAAVGDIIDWEVTPRNFGRIAAQSARQAILTEIRKAEKELVQSEFSGKVGEIINGNVSRMEGGSIIVDFQKSEGIISSRERVSGEMYNVGDRINALLLEIKTEIAGPSLILSRSNPNFVRKLFEREVAEIHDGVVEIVAIAREAGSRTKIAVKSNDPRVDPVGACVGMRGLRVRNITNELGGERIDIIQYDADIETFLENAMHPAKLQKIETDQENRTFTVYVDSENSRLAFGKKAQNVRLAQKLLDWKISIVVSKTEEEIFNEKKAQAVADLAGLLAVPEEEASLLVNNGYLTLEGLGNAGPEELAKIDGMTDNLLDAIKKSLETKQNEPAGEASAE